MTVRDSGGNVAVDFVWGNLPLQPNDDRGMAQLDAALDNHSIATTGYSNFPAFIPNYSGDGDTGLETAVPAFRGLLINDAQAAADAAGVSLNIEWATPVLVAAAGSAKSLTVTMDGTDAFVVGDVVSAYLNNGTDPAVTVTDATITNVNGAVLTLKLKTALAAAIDWELTGSNLYANWGGNVNPSYVMWQQVTAGQIVDAGSSVLVRVLQNND